MTPVQIIGAVMVVVAGLALWINRHDAKDWL